MSNNLKWALGLLIGAPLVLLALWIASRTELQPREREVGLRGEAARNPLLALERMAEALGLSCAASPTLLELPPENGVIVWLASGRFSSPAQRAQLRAWVERGGHFVLALPGDGARYDQILADVERGRLELPLSELTSARVQLANEPLDELTLDLGAGPRLVRSVGRFTVCDVDRLADRAIPDAERAFVVSYRAERGRVTLFASDSWLRNLQLGERDHARLAWDTLHLHGAPTSVLLVHGERPAGLIATLVRHAWMVLVSVALATALAIRRRAARFGPPLAEVDGGELAGRRDFSEHLIAHADHMLRIGARARLLRDARASVLRRLARRRPDLAALDPEARSAHLAEANGLSYARAHAALEGAPPGDADRFVRVVNDLNRLRRNV